jgi:hypothetical protein
MERNDLLYASKIFFNAAIPLLKVVVNDDEKIKASFAGSNAVIQIMAHDSDGDQGTYLQFKDGEPTMGRGIAATWDICLEFSSLSKFVAFFTGNMLALPKIHGFRRPILLAKALGLLIKLTALQAVDAPKSEADRERLVKLLMYLLPAGISQLNKAGHPEVAKWAGKKPRPGVRSCHRRAAGVLQLPPGEGRQVTLRPGGIPQKPSVFHPEV